VIIEISHYTDQCVRIVESSVFDGLSVRARSDTVRRCAARASSASAGRMINTTVVQL